MPRAMRCINRAAKPSAYLSAAFTADVVTSVSSPFAGRMFVCNPPDDVLFWS
jgi:hypothetical protein